MCVYNKLKWIHTLLISYHMQAKIRNHHPIVVPCMHACSKNYNIIIKNVSLLIRLVIKFVCEQAIKARSLTMEWMYVFDTCWVGIHWSQYKHAVLPKLHSCMWDFISPYLPVHVQPCCMFGHSTGILFTSFLTNRSGKYCKRKIICIILKLHVY